MITVIGLGFVGLTTALGFCSKGYQVFGYDHDNNKSNVIKSGKVPFFEPFLEEELKRNLHVRFNLVEDLSYAIKRSEAIFICVGTPSRSDGNADLHYVFAAIEEVLMVMNKKEYKVIVIKSTVPPSTTEEMIKPFINSFQYEVGRDIGLANNPEFLREGYAWEDFTQPDRIVIGEHDPRSGSIIEKYYQPFQAPIYKLSLNTAEFIKYLSNTLLSTLISFANEQSLIAHSIGNIDIKTSFQVLHKDRRWFGHPAKMASYVYPGCGFGGYCLPKDTLALLSQSVQKGYTPLLLEYVSEINQKIKQFVVQTVMERVQREETIGILGLSFKPGSDDVRNTPASEIIMLLLQNGYQHIIAYDPVAMETFHREYKHPINYASSIVELNDVADYILILTAWDEFKANKPLLLKKSMFDFRYIF